MNLNPFRRHIFSHHWHIGDVVKLKSGGPHATIAKLNPIGGVDGTVHQEAVIVWITEAGVINQATVPIACLSR
jgi:hypothetical protein